MANDFKIKTGDDLRKYPIAVQKAIINIDKLANQRAINIKSISTSLAPYKTGALKQGISSTSVRDELGIKISVVARKIYTMYQDVGTGRYVNLSYGDALNISRNYFLRFKGKGIKDVNIRDKHFFYGTIEKQIKGFREDLQKLLKQYTSR